MLDLGKRVLGKFKSGFLNGEEKRPSTKDLKVAACSLLLEMAETDGQFLESEKEKIHSIIREEYDLSRQEAVSLLESSEQELKESTDLWQFSNAVNQHCTLDEKLRLIENIWEIALTDGKLDQY